MFRERSVFCGYSVEALLSPPGTQFISGPKRGRLIREGVLIERVGGLFPNHIFLTKFTINFQTLLLHH